MTYIYDVLLNFNEKLYDFYDWNIDDNIVHIRKIPLIKINSYILTDINNNKFKVDSDFLIRIYNKTEANYQNKIETLSYACLFCDGLRATGVFFNKEGFSFLKTRMLIEEEEEVIEVSRVMVKEKLKYLIVFKEKSYPFKTRWEQEAIVDFKKKILDINDLEKLKYLYYECFNCTESDKKKMKEHLIIKIDTDFLIVEPILVSFFKLTSMKKP